jgi:hypothetical protein
MQEGIAEEFFIDMILAEQYAEGDSCEEFFMDIILA